jgi:hypothetical protein
MSSPVNSQIVILRPRFAVLVGNIVALNAPVQFAVCETLPTRGQLSISAFQTGLSAVTALLQCSIDQGASWFSIPPTSTFYGTTVFTGDTAAIVAIRFDVSGLCGSQMRFGFTAVSGLTSCPVYALQDSGGLVVYLQEPVVIPLPNRSSLCNDTFNLARSAEPGRATVPRDNRTAAGLL